jgi:hypothetical protein
MSLALRFQQGLEAVVFAALRGSSVSGAATMHVRTCLIVAGIVLLTTTAEADIVINIDKSRQSMMVSVNRDQRYSFVVSTGRTGYGTPNGVYHPQRLEKVWFSKEYYDSPMPHAIFFQSGYAIHGSYEISRLGGPASHGCVRLHPADAAKLFRLVQQEGMNRTRIVISGSNPSGSGVGVARSGDQERASRLTASQPGSWWSYNRSRVPDEVYTRSDGRFFSRFARPDQGYQVTRPDLFEQLFH